MITELEQAIRKSGQSLRVVAARADVPERTVTRIIHRQVDPKLGTLMSIAAAIGYDIALVKKEGQKREAEEPPTSEQPVRTRDQSVVEIPPNEALAQTYHSSHGHTSPGPLPTPWNYSGRRIEKKGKL